MSQGDPTPRELMEQCQGLVRALALKIHRQVPPQVELDDLIAYGQLGLAEAAAEYDPDRGIQFSTYSYYRIRGAIFDGLSKMSWISRSRYNRLRKQQLAEQVLAEDALGPDAAGGHTVEEDSRWLSQLAKRLAVVYLASRRDDDEGGDDEPVDGKTPTAEEVLERREIHEKLRLLIESLPSDAGQLIRCTYFEGMSQQQAAEQLGVSKSWASRLHAKTLDRLARGLQQMGLAD
jgi:RNA polymerase sigma factor FliA